MVPRLSPEAQQVLRRLLPKDGRGIEWGSGASTIWLAQRSRFLLSIEHDKHWYRWVGDQMMEAGGTYLITRLLVPVDKVCTSGQSCIYAGDIGVVGCFQSYVNAVRTISENFDYAFIDGRARVGCIHQVLPRLRPGGLLILDNSERSRYQEAKQLVGGWAYEAVEGAVDNILCQTVFWTKPGGE